MFFVLINKVPGPNEIMKRLHQRVFWSTTIVILTVVWWLRYSCYWIVLLFPFVSYWDALYLIAFGPPIIFYSVKKSGHPHSFCSFILYSFWYLWMDFPCSVHRKGGSWLAWREDLFGGLGCSFYFFPFYIVMVFHF